MIKTSYEEIASTCKLINFTDDYTREEVWRDSMYTYKCVWFPANDGFMPSTMYHTKNEKDL